MLRRASRIRALEVAARHEADDHAEHEARERIREALRQIPVLAPWTTYVAHEPSFSTAMNEDLAKRVEDRIFDELGRCYVRQKKQQDEREAAGIISKCATSTVLAGRLVVEAKRKIDVQRITREMKTDMKAAINSVNSSDFTLHYVASPGKAARPTSRLGQFISDNDAEKMAIPSAATDTIHAATFESRAATEQHDTEEREPRWSPLNVEFPPPLPNLSELVAQAESDLTTEDFDTQVTNFRQRPAGPSAVEDAGSTVSRRDVRPDRVRYIMSTRLGGLPPTKNILDEYPIPKEILEALETHRHYHIDESSLLTSFDSIKAGDSECYVRRSVPLERKPISFVLSSLKIASEQPVPPPSDIFQHHQQESATNQDIMLTDVQQLYDHTHASYRDFRASLHRHLELPYLVDLSFRSSLNSFSYFLDDDPMSSEASVQIPERLYRTATSLITKWRLARQGANGRMTTRRGAIAVQVKADSFKEERNDLLAKICSFTLHEIQLMELWYSYDADADADADADGATSFDPIPMRPDLSSRFDVVWKDLAMPAKERLDLAIKYSSLNNSSRLPDAVALWEVAAALIKEREELLRLVRIAMATPHKTAGTTAEQVTLLQDLAQTSAHVKEALLLTYIEVGDFVTLGGDFYLTTMEHEATELHQTIVECMDGTTHRTTSEGGTIGDLNTLAATASEIAGHDEDRDTTHREMWV